MSEQEIYDLQTRLESVENRVAELERPRWTDQEIAALYVGVTQQPCHGGTYAAHTFRCPLCEKLHGRGFVYADAELPTNHPAILDEVRQHLQSEHHSEFDAKLEADIRAGKFDKLAEEALADHAAGKTSPL